MNNELNALAFRVAARLGAVSASGPPARAVFPGGVIYLSAHDACEFAIVLEGAGALFVSIIAGRVVVEAAATNDGNEPRTRMRKKHNKLVQIATLAFEDEGDGIEHRDPMGFMGGDGVSKS